MNHFAQRCGADDAARQAAMAQTLRLIDATGIELVRFAWCDLHGMLRGGMLVDELLTLLHQGGALLRHGGGLGGQRTPRAVDQHGSGVDFERGFGREIDLRATGARSDPYAVGAGHRSRGGGP